jgi:hypothetical protein
MSIIEIVLLGLGLVAAFIAYQAHKAGVSFSAQASTDLATAKADVTADVHALELRIVALEGKVAAAIAPKPTAPAPATPSAP